WDEAQRGVWRLEVSGAVRSPLSLTLDDLMKMRSTTQKVDHFCVGGWTARAEWTGVRMSELARAAGVTADAQYVDFRSFDSDYHESWDIDSALHPQTLIAYGMDRALPIIATGKVHEYQSFIILKSPSGHMEGDYHFVRNDDSSFDAQIPRFELDATAGFGSAFE